MNMEKKKNVYETPVFGMLNLAPERGYAVSGVNEADCEGVSESVYRW